MSFFRNLRAELGGYKQSVVFSLPGHRGVLWRRRWLAKRAAHVGMVSVEPGCYFSGLGSMVINDRVTIGRNGLFVADGGRIEIGENAAFNSNVHINAARGGTISIGRHCLIGPNVVMRTANHRITNMEMLIRDQGHDAADIRIDDDCWVAANVVILSGVTLGRGSVVAAGAVVDRSVPEGAVVAGVPAKIVKMRDGSK